MLTIDNLPIAFINRMRENLGLEFDAFVSSYSEPYKRGLRVNTLRTSVEEFVRMSPWELCPSGILPEGFLLNPNVEKLGKHPYHAGGAFYLQEPSAMSVAAALRGVIADITEPKILDLCAAPGGKTGAVAAYMQGKGVIVANEIVPSRTKELAKNIERLGITNSVVTCKNPNQIAEKLPNYFDIVIVDAPCSGEGLFRRDESAVSEWSVEHVKACSVRQAKILKTAAACVCGGGVLCYSTCTFENEENEDVVNSFVHDNAEFSIVKTQRLYPHNSVGEGHFLCVMHKNDGERHMITLPKRKKNRLDSHFCEFVSETFVDGDELLTSSSEKNGNIIIADDEIRFVADELSALYAGIPAGKVNPGYFEPSHSLFVAAHKKEYKYNLALHIGSDELTSYLHGEVIKSPFPERTNAHCVVTVDGFPIGFGKITDGCIKNKLPKGLRFM